MTITLTIKSYATSVVTVPAVGTTPATTKKVAAINASHNTSGVNASVNLTNLDPAAYPETTYGAGKTVNITF